MEAHCLLAFDFGLNYIGVAVGDTGTETTSPLLTLKARAGQPDWQQVANLISEWQPDKLIVGIPLNMDGSESDMSKLAHRFARRLHSRFSLPVAGADERLSTFEARNSNPHEDRVDDVAAQIILQSYFGDPDAAIAIS